MAVWVRRASSGSCGDDELTNTATLVASNLAQFCPVTNHYACSDGSYLLVTVKSLGSATGLLETVIGISLPLKSEQMPTGTEVFRADESAVVLDADGDPANGMTPLLTLPDGTSFADALAQLGYTLVDS